MIDYKKKYLKYKKKYLEYKSKNFKGGLQKKLTSDELYNFRNKYLQKYTIHNKDCCVCVFKSMNLFEKKIENYLTINSSRIGMYVNQIVSLLQEYNTNYKYRWKAYRFNNIVELNSLYDNIQSGYASIGGYTFDTKLIKGHCVCYGKDNLGNLFLYDVQQKNIYWGVINIYNHLISLQQPPIICLWIIVSDQIIDENGYDIANYDEDWYNNDEDWYNNDEYNNSEYIDKYNNDGNTCGVAYEQENNEYLEPELRQDQTDGEWYTKEDFREEYGDEYYETVWSHANRN